MGAASPVHQSRQAREPGAFSLLHADPALLRVAPRVGQGEVATLLLDRQIKGLLLDAHPRFLQNKGLVLLFLTSLLGGLIVSFLHGFVPVILVSITDGVAAIIIAILAIIWCIFFLIGAIVSIFRSVT